MSQTAPTSGEAAREAVEHLLRPVPAEARTSTAADHPPRSSRLPDIGWQAIVASMTGIAATGAFSHGIPAFLQGALRPQPTGGGLPVPAVAGTPATEIAR